MKTILCALSFMFLLNAGIAKAEVATVEIPTVEIGYSGLPSYKFLRINKSAVNVGEKNDNDLAECIAKLQSAQTKMKYANYQVIDKEECTKTSIGNDMKISGSITFVK